MTTSHLKAKVQARINALTHPTPAFDLQQHAIDTVGLNLDLTNIKSVLNAATANIATATDDEITALNTASVALGVTINPNSTKYEINDVKPINSTKVKVIDSVGNEWIRSGWVETDVDNYPGAEVTAGAITSFSSSFSHSVHVVTPRGISFDPFSSRFYIFDASDSKCKIFDESGVYIGVTATLTTGPNTNVTSFVVYSNIIYVHQTSSIYSYTATGTYIEKLPHDFSKTASNTGTLGYDPNSHTFFCTNTGGMGGAIEILYVNQTNGDASRFLTTGVLSNYSPSGVGIFFGKLYLLTYNANTTHNTIYASKYFKYDGDSASLYVDRQLTANRFYGFTATKNEFYTLAEGQPQALKLNADIGAGQAQSESVNNQNNIVTIHQGKNIFKDPFLALDRSCQYAKLALLPNNASFNEFKQHKHH